jgi:hypothetical protein
MRDQDLMLDEAQRNEMLDNMMSENMTAADNMSKWITNQELCVRNFLAFLTFDYFLGSRVSTERCMVRQRQEMLDGIKENKMNDVQAEADVRWWSQPNQIHIQQVKLLHTTRIWWAWKKKTPMNFKYANLKVRILS